MVIRKKDQYTVDVVADILRQFMKENISQEYKEWARDGISFAERTPAFVSLSARHNFDDGDHDRSFDPLKDDAIMEDFQAETIGLSLDPVDIALKTFELFKRLFQLVSRCRIKRPQVFFRLLFITELQSSSPLTYYNTLPEKVRYVQSVGAPKTRRLPMQEFRKSPRFLSRERSCKSYLITPISL